MIIYFFIYLIVLLKRNEYVWHLTDISILKSNKIYSPQFRTPVMKHFFDNVRQNNQTRETEKEERDVLMGDIAHLRQVCGDSTSTDGVAGTSFIMNEKTRLYKIMHDL